MFWWLTQHLFITCVLVIIAAVLSGVLRHRPVLRHALWLIVLVKFLTPAFVYWPAEFRWAERFVATQTEPMVTPSTKWAFVEHDATAVLPSESLDLDASRLLTPPAESNSSVGLTPGVQLFRLFIFIWVLGSVLVLVRWLTFAIRTSRSLKHARQPPVDLQMSATWVAEKLKSKKPKIVVADGVSSPFVWCFGRAKIVWPTRWLGSSVHQQKMMLVHEAAHLRRRDHWTAWIELIASAVWWWNPAFWWAKRNLRENAELACDMWVMRIMPNSCREYSETLIELGRKRHPSQLPLTVGAVSSQRSIFKRRLTMIMSQRKPRTRLGVGGTFVAMFALLALPGLRLDSSRLNANPNDSAATTDTGSKAGKDARTKQRTSNDVVIISEILKRVEASYFKDVDQQVLVDAAIDAVVKKLDAETEYLDSDRHRQFQQSINPNFVGIGARLEMDDQKRVKVVEPIPGSPAQEAGLLPGDQIVVVNQTDLKKFSENQRLAETVKLIRGEQGTTAKLVVSRQGTNDLVEIAIKRGRLRLSTVSGFRPYRDGKPVYYCDPDKKIGYVHIRAFMSETASEVANIVKTLEQENANAIVLDLRFNGGGALSEAVATANIFVDEGTILTVKKRNGEDDDIHVAEPERRLTKLPMAVLVNSQTASAAEIVAACLQDHKRATVIGQRSFGMGRVKSLVELSNGAALKLPIATVHRANGSSLHREPDMNEKDDWGVSPDEGQTIEVSKEESAMILEKITNPRSLKSAPVADRQLKRSIEVVQKKIKS